MYHPLLADASKLKDQELDNKIVDLSKKYFIAARLGQGLAAQQIAVILESLKDEQRRRHIEASQKIMRQQDKGLDDLINVN
jgi:hypothetical protein